MSVVAAAGHMTMQIVVARYAALAFTGLISVFHCGDYPF